MTRSHGKLRRYRRSACVCLAAASICLLATAASARNWYVDGLNGSKANSGSKSSPYLYLWQALQKVAPGDTILLVASMTYPQQGFSANGTPRKPITLAGASASKPTKVSGQGVNSGVWINGNYLVVRNLDVTAPGPYPAVSIPKDRHHITVTGNVIHDAGVNGVNVFGADYVTISNNLVYGNSKSTQTASGSGISILASVDIDQNTGNKIVIDGNVVYDNTNLPDCMTSECMKTAADSDGSGIILDDNQRQRFDSIAYKGGFLISNNVIYHNGGRGIHIYRSDNATITGNTMWKNNQDPYESFWHPGEVAVREGCNVGIYNNIMYSDGLDSPLHSGTAPNSHVVVAFESCTNGRGPLIAQHNIGYNPQKDQSLFSYVRGNTGRVVTGPNKFIGPGLAAPTDGDFRFNPGSPAYGAGNLATSVAVDILGTARQPQPSMGAYQDPVQ